MATKTKIHKAKTSREEITRGREVDDITGQRFGSFTITGYSRYVNRNQYWYGECDCGKQIELTRSNLPQKAKTYKGVCQHNHWGEQLGTLDYKKNRLNVEVKNGQIKKVLRLG